MTRRMTPVLVVAMVAAAVAALVLSSRFLEEERSAAREPLRGGGSRAVPVVLEPVAHEPERTRIEAVGTSRAIRSVTLYPATTGEVVAVNFEANQRVTAGEVLVELDRRDAELAVELARVRVADAQRLWDRYQRTEGSGALPPTTLDTARTALEAARIERRRAEVALEDRSIEAPFGGFVGITEVEPGDRIDPDTAITTLDDRGGLLVSFEVPELYFERIRVGETVSIATWAQRGVRVDGSITEVGSRIDPVSRTFVVRARVPNPEDRLRPGMSFRVTLALEGATWPVVPEVAVQWGGDGAYVWAVEADRARRVGVDIVQRRAGRVLLDAELADGVAIVVEGVQRMREGQAVRPLDPTEDGEAFIARRARQP